MPLAENGIREGEGLRESLLPATQRFESGTCQLTHLKDVQGSVA